MKMWVGCLAAYNSGRLFGEWHDVSTDAEENSATIADVLTRSPIKGAEEWALMDSEGPRALVDLLGENPGYDTLADAARIEGEIDALGRPDDVDAILGVMLDGVRASDLADLDAEEWFSDHFAGEGDTLADWCSEFLDDTGFFGDLPKGDGRSATIERYFDFESYARDLQLGGDVSTVRSNGRLLVFWSR